MLSWLSLWLASEDPLPVDARGAAPPDHAAVAAPTDVPQDTGRTQIVPTDDADPDTGLGCGPFPLPTSADARDELGMWCGDAGDPWTIVRACIAGDFLGGWEIATHRGWDTTRRWIAADGTEIVAMNRRDADTGGCRAVRFGEVPACDTWTEVARSSTCSLHALDEVGLDTAQAAADPVADWWGEDGPVFPADPTGLTDSLVTDASVTDDTDASVTDDTDDADPGCGCAGASPVAGWTSVAAILALVRTRRARPGAVGLSTR